MIITIFMKDDVPALEIRLHDHFFLQRVHWSVAIGAFVGFTACIIPHERIRVHLRLVDDGITIIL